MATPKTDLTTTEASIADLLGGVKSMDDDQSLMKGVFRKTFQLTDTPLRVQFNAGANPFAEPENKRKAGEGIVSMRRRKTAQRAELKAKKDEENKKR